MPPKHDSNKRLSDQEVEEASDGGGSMQTAPKARSERTRNAKGVRRDRIERGISGMHPLHMHACMHMSWCMHACMHDVFDVHMHHTHAMQGVVCASLHMLCNHPLKLPLPCLAPMPMCREALVLKRPWARVHVGVALVWG